jgi:hypothetical protein
MFEQLCGAGTLQNVILTTTMWDVVEAEIGSRREKQLLMEFWRPMMDKGCRMARFNFTSKSAWEIINNLVVNGHRPLDIQEEMVDNLNPLAQTAAGSVLFRFIHRLTAKLGEMLRKRAQAREDFARSESRWWKRIIAKLRKMICWPAARPRRSSNDPSPMV